MKQVTKEKFENLLDTLKTKFRLINKYNYNIDEVIGVKVKERYILYVRKKLIRIYRGALKASPLLCSYLPIENAIFYNFKIEKSVIEKVDLKSFIETKVYEEAGVEETEEYIIKYKVVDNLKDNKYVVIETVIVPVTFLNRYYQDILNESGYIDYISFPAFSYKALYEEKILKKANDLFIVLLYDKIFLTFYSEGELVFMQTLSGGLDKLYDSLSSLKIKEFNFELFKKLLTKKGLAIGKYSSEELIVFEVIKKEFNNIVNVLKEQIIQFFDEYRIEDLERVFITSEYGDLKGLEEFIEQQLEIEARSFEFYEKYNLDRLPVDPFLFLSMLEAHYAYQYNDLTYNFSLFLRKPTFFYRPSGILFISSFISMILLGIYPFYLWILGMNYENMNNKLSIDISKIESNRKVLQKTVISLSNKEKLLDKNIKTYEKDIKELQKFIEEVYKFKYSYLPKSQELVDITYIMNKNKVFAKNINYKKGIYIIKVFSYNESDIPSFIKDLSDNGFSVDFDEIVYKGKKYNSEIRVKE